MEEKLVLRSLADNSILELQEFMNLGKDSSCQIQVSGEGVADRHARIEQRNNQIFVKDLRTEQGTFINDAQIIESRFQPGDILRIGSKEWTLVSLNAKSEFPLKSKNTDWQRRLDQLEQAARSEFPILLLGPSGTGKDVIAQTLHQFSSRRLGPFMSVNCSALTETLIESELFGHVKGSFTGAVSDRKGAFEAARGGTLFLDEIGDLPYSLQAKLLRALENNEVRPVGSDRVLKTDIRVIAATHQNLTEKISEGHFRSDLFYRLNVVTVQTPSLIERMEDFDDLFYIFAKQMRVRFSFGAIQRLKKHQWPGNIRELKNLISRASALMPNMLIDEKQVEDLLDKGFQQLMGTAFHDSSTPNLPVIKEIEKQMIIKRLAANKGNQRRTANELGMPKSTLHDRLSLYKIDVNQFKEA